MEGHIMAGRPIGAVTFDLWDCLFHDDSDEPKRAAAGLPTKAKARRDLLHSLLSKHAPIDRALSDLAFDVQDAAFRKVWHDQHVTWSVTERMQVLLDGLGRTLPADDFAALVDALERMELEYQPNPAPGAVEALARLHGKYPLAIVSDAIFTPGRNLRELLRGAGMLEHFDFFVFSDEIGRSKPHPAVYEAIAAHYGIPSLNLAQYAAEKIIAREISFAAFSADGINPTDAGARIYAEAVAKFVNALMTANPIPDKPKSYKLPAPLFPETDDNGRIVAYEDQPVKRTGNWKPGQASPIGPFRHLLVSSEAGATLTLKFKGSEVGILDVVDKDSADYEYAVDGASFRRLPAPKHATSPAMRPVALAKGLDRNAEHELVLKVALAGTARMGGFLVNGTVADTSASLSTLERIDAIYAGMDPIVYRPPAGRFANIPKTMTKLRDGGELRMVLLGDSIMGNTSGSSFELLLMRDYPKCKVVKIASLRSSTGCKYYREDNRVQDYVLKHNPDLLVIGGISNGGDAEAVRSVIQQIRAKKPDTEVLLLTPVFGSTHDEHIRTFTREIDTTKSNFRFNMQKVAAEEKCAFFDMTGPWWSYIQDSGKTYGWFMGDAVHANNRGCQIIGRLLETWFKE